MGTAEVRGLSVAHTTLKSILDDLKKDDTSLKHQQLIDQAFDIIMDGNERLLQIQTTMIEIQRQNAALSEQIQAAKAWESRIAKYSVFQAPGGGIVFRANEPFVHYACPRCAETEKQLHSLQPGSLYTGLFACPGCRCVFAINPPREIPDAMEGTGA